MITPKTKVSQLLDEHPELLEVLASFHPHFGKLRNRVLRRVMAPRVTLEQAAQIAGADLGELLLTLNHAAGYGDSPKADLSPSPPYAPSPRPPELADLRSDRCVYLDVREDLRADREPYAKVMAAVRRLGADQVLVLRNIFEPIPLYDLLGARGFSNWTERLGEEDWQVYFYRSESAKIPAPHPAREPEAGGPPFPN